MATLWMAVAKLSASRGSHSSPPTQATDRYFYRPSTPASALLATLPTTDRLLLAATVGRNRATFGATRAKFGGLRAMFGRSWPMWGRTWSKPSYIWSNLDQTWSMSGHSWSNLGRNTPNTGRVWAWAIDAGPMWSLATIDWMGPAGTPFQPGLCVDSDMSRPLPGSGRKGPALRAQCTRSESERAAPKREGG